ncbi:MAG TPA: sugar ABC transporter substrate-binding protein [Chthoniobacterales bacterium]|nr:sugar ABC transporter substrate-binding protein [Chthoniobacterales bacterium]
MKIRSARFFQSLFRLFAAGLIMAASSASAATTIRWLTLSNGSWPDSLKKVVTAFEAENPDIKVELDTYPFRQLFETIEVRMKAQDANLDVISVDVPLVASYAIRGYLAPLDEYFTADDIKNTWLEASGKAGSYNGHFMAAPQNTSSQFMYINRKLFQDAGITPPKGFGLDQTIDFQQITDIASNDRWTWEQVVDAAKKLTKESGGKTDVWGLEFDQVSRLYQMQCLGESLGQPLLSPDGLKASGYLNSEKWIQAAQWYSDLFNKWKVSPKNVSPDESPNLFTAGKVAIFVGGEWNVPRFKEAGVDFLVAPFPYFAGGKPVTGTGSWHIGIAKSSQHKAEAAKFIKFLTATEKGNQIWFDAQGQVPSTLALQTAIEQDPQYRIFPKDAYLLAIYEANHSAVNRPSTPGYLQVEDLFFSTFEDIRNGVNPKDALDGAARRLDRALAQFHP